MNKPQISVVKENNNITIIVTNNGVDYRYLITGCVALEEDVKVVFEKTLNAQPSKRAALLRSYGLIFAGYYEEI